MHKILLTLTAGLAALPALAQPAPTAPGFDVAAALARIDATIDRQYPHLDALYKDLHAHPEVGFQEVRTAPPCSRPRCASWASPSPKRSARPVSSRS
jgi:hippurate hydrolase